MNNFFREGIVTRIIASEKSWIEGEAVQQLNKTATLPGMYMAVGIPDLHPGKGHPIGAAFVTKNLIYPALVGNDIGCGMGLWQTDIALKKLKIERWLKKLDDMEGKWNGNISEWKQNQGLLVSNDDNSNYDYALGTIGGGNHFAELQKIHSIIDLQKFNNLNLNQNNAFLLVHSGSRGLGESILRTHLDLHGHEGISSESKEAELYLDQHHYALTWAKANRALIAERFLSILGRNGQNILDICHNAVLPIMMNSTLWWIHRKGATPSTQGIVMIPGSRGTLSYLVEPIGEQLLNAYSLAHGAGRK